jgi:hypothetical protein
VADLVKLLTPFYQATQDLQGEKYPTMSRVWRHLAKLEFTLENIELVTDEAKEVCELLQAEMTSDRSYLKVDQFMVLCTVLDPTMKVRCSAPHSPQLTRCRVCTGLWTNAVARRK